MCTYYSHSDLPKGSFGGKADGLIFLTKNSFHVPPYYIIPDRSIQAIIAGQLTPEQLFHEWITREHPDPHTLWALRSSAEVEDGTAQSYAGQFQTVLNCKAEALPAALAKVITGFKEVQSSAYHKGEAFGCHVIIQEMVQGEIAGVGFSVNPLDQDNENPMVNIIPGAGFRLVSGEENGMSIDLAAARVTILSTQEMYNGQVFEGEYKDVTWSSEELFQKAAPALNTIREQLRWLKELKGYEVDTEFTIAAGKVYWLQVRPITALIPKGSYIVWDNSNLSINYPGVTLPLTSSYMRYSYSRAYISMARFLGAGASFVARNNELFQNMLGTIQGGMYYNITAWQQLLYQLPFGRKTSRLITKMMGAADAKFSKPATRFSPLVYAKLFFNLMKSIVFFGYYKRKYLAQYHQTLSLFEGTPLGSHEALIALHDQLASALSRYWYPPMINGFFAMLSYNGFKKIIPDLLNDAISGIGDVISVEIVRALQELIRQLHAHEAVKNIILEQESSEALLLIQTAYPAYYALIMSYLDKYGERCDDGEMKMETVNYREDPTKFISLLKANLSIPYQPRAPSTPFDYVQRLKQYHPVKRWLLRKGLVFTINRVRDRENFRFIRTKSFAMARQIFRAMDQRLLEKGSITTKGDTLYLQFEELMNPQLNSSYQTLISERKEAYAVYQTTYQPTRFHQIGEQFFAIEKAAITDQALSGTGCSSGIVTGEALLVHSQNIHGLDVEGKILIATFFEPGWIGLFARAGGLIAEKGSLLSHTAILCREMGIPLIVSATTATQTIRDGETIKMNGATGSIERLSIHE
ncbi:PEP/pyruvate-binding domain-containing protein [Chitinophaga sp.]|uniref:PEP/pyruvate-binding domain-containing protein n=1 Tax=Chitinophaga sp. TaxID=1869181 RepID=UPI0031DB85F7